MRRDAKLPRITPPEDEVAQVRESTGLSWVQRAHLLAGTLALSGVLLSLFGGPGADPSTTRQPRATWRIEIDTGRKGQQEATLSFPDLPMTRPVTLDGRSTLSLTVESQVAPRIASLRFADGQMVAPRGSSCNPEID